MDFPPLFDFPIVWTFPNFRASGKVCFLMEVVKSNEEYPLGGLLKHDVP